MLYSSAVLVLPLVASSLALLFVFDRELNGDEEFDVALKPPNAAKGLLEAGLYGLEQIFI